MLNNIDIEYLAKWCDTHKLDEKVILTSNLKQGNNILKSLLRNDCNYINLNTKTIEDIAKESIDHIIIKEDKKIISDIKSTSLIKQTLKELKKEGKLQYYNEIKLDFDISKYFYEVITELKLEKVDLKLITDPSIKNKIKDLELIFNEYNKKLADKNYLDKGDVHILAIEKGNFSKGYDKYCISLYDETISKTEEEIIEKYAKELMIIKEENKEEKENIEMFSGYGETNELYEILRRIKSINNINKKENKELIKFEDIAIYHTSNEKYVQRMYELSEILDVPVSFEDGISISNKREAKLIYKIVEWVKSDYRDDVLYELVNYLALDGEVTSNDIKTLLSKLDIGFGKDRYIKKISNYIDELKSKIEKDEEKENDNKILLEKITKQEKIQSIIEYLINNIPDKETTYEEVIKGLKNILEKFKYEKPLNKMKVKSYTKYIFEALNNLTCIEEKLDINDILQHIENVIQKITVPENSEGIDHESGKIYFAHYNNGYYSDRKYHFIVGLDSDKFPKKVTENPILNDYDRKKINEVNNNNLKLSASIRDKQESQMLDFINSRKGDLCISYCGFDFKSNSKNMPSYLFLEQARKIYNNPNLNYDTLNDEIGKMKGFVDLDIDKCLSKKEEWLSYFLNSKKIPTSKDMPELYNNNLDEDLNNEEKSDSYDWRIDDKAYLKVRDNKEKSMSPSQITEFIKCPYKYFLKYILQVKEQKPRKSPDYSWLHTTEFGNLMHGILENFYNQVKNNNETLEKEKHLKDIKEIAEAELEIHKEKYPILSQMQYDDTYNRAMSICEKFIEEEINKENTKVVEVEYAFGNGINKTAIELNENNEVLYVNGKIDRIDKINENEYEIIDYKSGKATNNREDDLKYGLNMQNIIYALAYNQGLDKDINIEKTKYYLLNDEDINNEYILSVNEENINECKDILNEMLDLIEHGCFVKGTKRSSDFDPCGYCDYKPICDYEPTSKKELVELETYISSLDKKDRINLKGGLEFYGNQIGKNIKQNQ